jgi:hypothetical protein
MNFPILADASPSLVHFAEHGEGGGHLGCNSDAPENRQHDLEYGDCTCYGGRHVELPALIWIRFAR